MNHSLYRTPPHATARFNRPCATAQGIAHSGAHRDSGLAAAALVLGSALSFGAPAERPKKASPVDDGFASAVKLYEAGRWDESFHRLAALADDGHPTAAKLALLMLRYGAAIYQTNFDAHPEQVARWAQRVLRATSRETASPSSMTAMA